MSSSELISALRDAHKTHLTQQLQNPDHWQALLTQASTSLGKTPLGKLVDSDSLSLVVEQWVLEANSAQGLQDVIVQTTEAVLKAAEQDDATVGQLLSEAHFEAVLEKSLQLKTLREKAIHAGMNHPLVSEMVSEMLYTGIKNFLLEENVLAKLPGVSSMMKLGRKSVGKAMGGLEDSIRDYLRHNTRATLKTGEQWLNRQLTDQRIAELARDGYRRLAPLKPADVIKTAPKGLAGDVATHACAIGDEAARLDYSRRLVAAGIQAAVQALLEKDLPALLKAMGTTPKKRSQALAPALAAGAAVLDQQGVLTPWIEQAVGDFYDSDACKDVLENALS